MNVLAWILGIILAGAFGAAGIIKVLDRDPARKHFGYTKRQYQMIGLTELAGAAGVIVGLVWTKIEWLGIAAAVGICTLMLGALMAHARVEDEGKKVIPALAMMVIAIAYIVVISLR